MGAFENILKMTLNKCSMLRHFNPLSAKLTNCLSVFGHFVGLAVKGLNVINIKFAKFIK